MYCCIILTPYIFHIYKILRWLEIYNYLFYKILVFQFFVFYLILSIKQEFMNNELHSNIIDMKFIMTIKQSRFGGKPNKTLGLGNPIHRATTQKKKKKCFNASRSRCLVSPPFFCCCFFFFLFFFFEHDSYPTPQFHFLSSSFLVFLFLGKD